MELMLFEGVLQGLLIYISRTETRFNCKRLGAIETGQIRLHNLDKEFCISI